MHRQDGQFMVLGPKILREFHRQHAAFLSAKCYHELISFSEYVFAVSVRGCLNRSFLRCRRLSFLPRYSASKIPSNCDFYSAPNFDARVRNNRLFTLPKFRGLEIVRSGAY